MSFPIVVGGAAINRDFGRRIAFIEDERLFEPGVFYAKDAFEGLDIVDRLTASAEVREAFRAGMLGEARAARKRALAAQAPATGDGRTARPTLTYGEAPRAPFLGARVVDDIDLRTLWPCFDLKSLYRLSWGGANAKGEAWDALVRDEFAPRLAAYQRRAEAGGVLAPKAVYGYFPAAAHGDAVVVYDPADPKREIARFPFTRHRRSASCRRL